MKVVSLSANEKLLEGENEASQLIPLIPLIDIEKSFSRNTM